MKKAPHRLLALLYSVVIIFVYAIYANWFVFQTDIFSETIKDNFIDSASDFFILISAIVLSLNLFFMFRYIENDETAQLYMIAIPIFCMLLTWFRFTALLLNIFY